MLDATTLENNQLPINSQGKIEKPDILDEPTIDRFDPMAHATKLEKSPADKTAEEEITKLLENLPKEKPISASPAKAVKKPEQPTKVTINQSKGFLMPFINGFNGLVGSIWEALKSLIPMKQTGTGTT